jgi:hypothetical protein
MPMIAVKRGIVRLKSIASVGNCASREQNAVDPRIRGHLYGVFRPSWIPFPELVQCCRPEPSRVLIRWGLRLTAFSRHLSSFFHPSIARWDASFEALDERVT